ncbi:hypothetical protein HW532_03510 [Kaustia mangrovi]|uniref:Stringent starvation protein B n=1 Tax=Kaustia mangrovi TaxID=2593653 RepID=A0A7S8HAW5_9HYPH|nr:ClpXP protease specificity-enhancing factor SspB [Kaustia mangrovi]QPC41864.1 hypothetical protein HW532_03510 [Kaustia mangrovi]
MSEDLMRYDLLAQDALRGVVRAALRRVSRVGLPGEHHFYIAFDTNHPGARLSDRLRKKYPKEMTVVLQHQFWNLQVTEERFEVELSFDNIPEKLVVPFASVKGFFDPSVQFGLQFEVLEANENAEGEAGETAGKDETAPGQPAAATAPKPPAAPSDASGTPDNDTEEQPDSPAKIVQLDAFRKK